MATLGTQNIGTNSVRMKYREPYVTAGVNAVNTAQAPGCYRGFWIDEAVVPSTAIRLRPYETNYGTASGVSADSFALVVNQTNGYALGVLEASDVTLDLATLGVAFPLAAPLTVWISMSITYTTAADTVADYYISDSDPRVGDPYATVIGSMTIAAGAADVRIYTAVINTTLDYTERTTPQATEREALGDYVAGDHIWGLLEGRERWCLPTTDEKKALDGASTAADASNPYVTEADTTNRVFAEPTVYQATITSGSTWVIIAAANGPFYIGTGALGTAQNYFALCLRDTNDAVTRVSGDLIYIENVYNGTGAHVLNPAAEADALGFYTGDIRLDLNIGATTGTTINVDLIYGKKKTYVDLSQAPAYALAHAIRHVHDHADRVRTESSDNPTGLPLQFDANVSDWLYKIAHKTRGTRNTLQTEANVGQRIYTDARTPQHVHNEASQEDIGAVSWPRCWACGYDNVTTTAGTTEGNRYVLYTVTQGGVEQVYRWTVQDYDDMTSGVYLDVVAQAYNDNILDVAAKADWKIVSMICSGQYLYVRLLATTAGGTQRSVIDCYDIVNLQRRTTWVTSVTIGDPAVADSTWDDDINHNALHIILANSSTIAVNQYWEDVLDGGAVDRGIALYSATDGSFIAAGYGNATDYSLDTEAEIVGPMVSDGTNIYFGMLSDQNAGTRRYWGIGQCQIADPTTVQLVNTFPELDTTPYLAAAGTPQCGRSLVYDGKYVWLHTRFCAFGGNPSAQAGEAILLEFDNTYIGTHTFEFGPAAFDGRNLWFCVEKINPVTYDVMGECHLVRFNPGTLMPSFDGATYWPGDWATVFATQDKWGLYPPQTGALNIGGVSDVPFGAILYNGDSLWWTLAWDGSAGAGLRMQRLICAHGR
jgi:hypothetical protein